MRSRAVGVGRNVQTMGCRKLVAAIHRRSGRKKTWRLSHRASHRYGNGRKSGEYTNRFSRSSRKPFVLRHQLRIRWRTRVMSLTPGARTPVFSMNSTRLPCAASVLISSW